MASSAYPATFSYQTPERIANWRPLVHWLLAIPHFVVLYVLGIVSQVLALVAWIVILVTGRLPEGMANFQSMYIRYYSRVITYAAFMREEYPPFSFTSAASDPGDDPRVRVDIRPALDGRNRVTVALRLLLAIPQLLVLAVLAIGAYIAGIIAFFVVLFTGRWPEGMLNFVLGVARWAVRVQAYFLLLTDEYPPFSMD